MGIVRFASTNTHSLAKKQLLFLAVTYAVLTVPHDWNHAMSAVKMSSQNFKFMTSKNFSLVNERDFKVESVNSIKHPANIKKKSALIKFTVGD